MFSAVFILSLTVMVSEVFSKLASDGIIILSFDGVNDEFLHDAQVLSKPGEIGQHCARAGRLQSENITKTFSTHFTVATGLYSNIHGVIANEMFDKNGNKIFNTEEQFKYKTDVEPLWIESLSKNIKSACMMWPGCQFPYGTRELKATHVTEYKSDMEWNDRIDDIVKWAVGNDADLILGYFEDSPNADFIDDRPFETIRDNVVGAIQYLQKKLDDAGHSDSFDIIIMSDHGTKSVKKEKLVNVNLLIPPGDFDVIASGAIAFIRPKSPTTDNVNQLYNHLINVDSNSDNQKDHGTLFKVYKDVHKDATMKKWNLYDLPLLENVIFLTAIEDHAIYSDSKISKIKAGKHEFIRENGYEEDDKDMDGILILKGPTFNNTHLDNDELVELNDINPLVSLMMGLGNENDKNEIRNSKLMKLIEEVELKNLGLTA